MRERLLIHDLELLDKLSAFDLEVLATEEVDWVAWARAHKLLPESDQPVR